MYHMGTVRHQERLDNPHSAPPTVTVGFFGFLLTLKAAFSTFMA